MNILTSYRQGRNLCEWGRLKSAYMALTHKDIRWWEHNKLGIKLVDEFKRVQEAKKMDRICVFLEMVLVDGDFAIREVEKRDIDAWTYFDDKFQITIYAELPLAIGFSEGLYIGMYLAMKKD